MENDERTGIHWLKKALTYLSNQNAIERNYSKYCTYSKDNNSLEIIIFTTKHEFGMQEDLKKM